MTGMFDLEYDLMSYCLRQTGRWWATHFWRNREVDVLYTRLRKRDIGTVIAILGSNSADYEKHIRLGEKVRKLLNQGE